MMDGTACDGGVMDNTLLDCPRSGPGLVRPLFVDPGPGPGHEYCGVMINKFFIFYYSSLNN